MADAGRFLAAFIAAGPGDGGGRDNLSVEFALKILSAQGVDKRKMKPMPSESPEDPMPPSQSMPATVTVTKTLISTQVPVSASTTVVSPTSTPPSATETPVQNADPNSTQTSPADPNSTQTVPAAPDSAQTAPAQNSDSSDVPEIINSSVYENLENILTNKDGKTPLYKRFRAIFTLRNIADEKSIDILSKAFFGDDSTLLKHELAYVLGQIKNPYAIPILCKVLTNKNEDPMVRHEAAEALGAIGDLSSMEVLQKYLNDEQVVVRETCELAIEKIKFENSNDNDISNSIYKSIDPAPPNTKIKSASELGKILMDTNLPLFERYKAMFTLRDLGTTESVLELAKGLEDQSSALFRHEIAFVFGQMQNPASVTALKKALENVNELDMVRHEAAEALGSIATPECLPILKKFKEDQERVVKESCEVALDMYEYEISQELQEDL
nr:3963_t:CDS:2 [Entrophospora candida]